MEPSPETQAAFMAGDQWFIENVVKRAHHWAPSVAVFVGAALLLRPWGLLDVGALGALWWALVNSDERNAALGWIVRQIGGARKKAAPGPIFAGAQHDEETAAMLGLSTADSAPALLLGDTNQTRPNNPIKSLGNVLGAIGSVVSFLLRYWQPLTLIAIVLIAWLVLRPVLGPAFHWVGAAWGAMFPNEEEASARVDIRVAETETKIATQAIESAERTHIITREVVRIVEQADSEISNAVEDNDFAQLYRAYRDGYERVWDNGAGDAPADPPQLRGLLALGSG